MIKLITATVVSVSLVGCASIFSGTTQSINVKVVDSSTNKKIPDASCRLTSYAGNVFTVATNPDTINLDKKEGNLTVNCTAKGYTQDKMGVSESMDGWMIGNILFWPGFIIDWADDAYHRYPEFVTVVMSPVA